MNNSPHSTFSIGCKEKYVKETVSTKFLGLKIDNPPKFEELYP